MGKYDHLERDALVRLLERRDAERQLGLVWERDEPDPEVAANADFVALEQDEALSHGDSPWQNLIIEGDNHDALRAVRMSHAGRIRCIYIDPPYNTGNRDFVHNDRFVDRTHRFRHSLWLEFMHKRLVLARELLADDGVIFVSIDDNELFRLGMLMDRVFGEDNFIANVIWQKVFSPKKTAQHFSDDHESVMVFARNRNAWRPNPIPRTQAQDKAYLPLDRAQRNVYGVFPPDLNPDERRIADVLDGHALVGWWHRNPIRKPGVSVALYGWDAGDGVFPDFAVGMDQRLWAVDKEPARAEAVHPDYGRVFMAGRRRGDAEFLMLHKNGDKLDGDGPFALERMRWV